VRVVARKPLHLLCGMVFFARLPSMRKASWRICRMARRKKDVPDLPYTAPPLSCAAFFFKEQARGLSQQISGKGDAACVIISNLK